jgi:DNA-binding LytR/AlgR family response regulator
MSEITTSKTHDSPVGKKKRFVVFYKESILSIKVTDVSFFTLQKGTVQLYTLNGKIFPLKKSLSEIEAVLNPDLFFRVSRSAIVSYEAIEKVETFFGQRAVVFLKPSGKVLVTKGRLAEFLEWLDN